MKRLQTTGKRRSCVTVIIMLIGIILPRQLSAQTLKPQLISPVNGERFVNARSFYLQWSREDFDTFHVYYGSDSAQLMLINTTTLQAFHIPDLDTNKTYYWRVIGVRPDGTRDTSAISRWTTGNIFLQSSKFLPAQNPSIYDTELDSRRIQFSKHVDLRKTAIVITDFWSTESPNAPNVLKLIEFGRRHGIPIYYSNHGMPLPPIVEPREWEFQWSGLLTPYFDAKGIRTLIYAGWGSGECINITRPNSINSITLYGAPTPLYFDIILLEDCTGGVHFLHYWNVNSVESRWQTSTITDLAHAFGDSDFVAPSTQVYGPVDDLVLPIRSNLPGSMSPDSSVLLVVNAWKEHKNDGWLNRIQMNNRENIAPLIAFARSRRIEIIHVHHQRPVDSLCSPLQTEKVFTNKDSLKHYVKEFKKKQHLWVVGNFDNDLNSIFPLSDGWGLTYNMGKVDQASWIVPPDSKVLISTLVFDGITVFETPDTYEGEKLKKIFLYRQIYGDDGLGITHYLETVSALRSAVNRPPEILILTNILAKEDSLFSSRVFASDADSLSFGDYVHYRITEGPGWLSIDSITGLLTGTPLNNMEGDTTFSVTAYDQWGASSQKKWNIKILPTNYPPSYVDAIQPLHTDTLTLFKIPIQRTFSWTSAKDPDTKDTVKYTFELRGSNLDTLIGGILDTSIVLDESILSEQVHYMWRVYASDGEFATSTPNSFTFQTTKRVSNSTYTEGPTKYFLYQNYPNPFNPITTIRFQVPEESDVKIEVYNILGQLMQEVFKGKLGTKYYEMEWRPQATASGIYFVKFTAEGLITRKKFQSVKKVTYIK